MCDFLMLSILHVVSKRRHVVKDSPFRLEVWCIAFQLDSIQINDTLKPVMARESKANAAKRVNINQCSDSIYAQNVEQHGKVFAQHHINMSHVNCKSPSVRNLIELNFLTYTIC
jgi:hypothetical protein